MLTLVQSPSIRLIAPLIANLIIVAIMTCNSRRDLKRGAMGSTFAKGLWSGSSIEAEYRRARDGRENEPDCLR
jgi:hypothetical protein